MSERIIDFHTHAFSDALAPRAMKKLLEEAPDVKAYLDGTVSSLLASMDECGIERSVICCIATRPVQFAGILKWCEQIQNDRLTALPSVHPAAEDVSEQIRQIKAGGFKGIKMHPYYQDFYMDEERMFPIYESAGREGLMLVMHTGYDIAFEHIRRADPQRILNVKRKFPELKLITTHLGAWQQWDEVEQLLIGQEIYMEISFSLEYIEREQARRMILGHPDGYVLFGTDSPWTQQKQTLFLLKELEIPAKKLKEILSDNALKLLDVM